MAHILQIDVQLQSLEENYQQIKTIKANDSKFSDLLEYL